MHADESLVQAEAVADEDLLALLLQRDLQPVVVQDLDERVAQAGHVQSVADALDEEARVDVGADVAQQYVDEGRPALRVVDQLLPQLGVVVRLAELDGAVDVVQLIGDQPQRVARVAHPRCLARFPPFFIFNLHRRVFSSTTVYLVLLQSIK